MNLLNYRYNVYSQAGQDGIIRAIFNILDIKRGNFVEFGTWDGIHLSNCKYLFDKGWSGTFIEADKEKFEQLQENYKDYKDIYCLNETVTPNNFDDIYQLGRTVDFMSIDIDGLDLEVFENIARNLPLVVCIEGGQAAYPLEKRQPEKNLLKVGQSLKTIDGVMRKKGYRILCSFQDVIAIRVELFDKFDVSKNLWEIYIDSIYPLRVIPMHVNRLKRVGRKNRIFDFILSATNYKQYDNNGKWSVENGGKIQSILDFYKNGDLC